MILLRSSAGRADMARSELGHPGERRHDPYLPVDEVDDDGTVLDKDDPSEAELVVCYQVVQLILLGRRLLGRWLEGTCGQVTPVRGAGTVDHDWSVPSRDPAPARVSRVTSAPGRSGQTVR